VAAAGDSALLCLDFLAEIVANLPDPGVAERAAEAAGSARAQGLPVLHVAVGFRPGYPEVSADNAVFSAAAERGLLVNAGFHPAMEPEDGDQVLTKRRVSAFIGSDLEVMLRSLGVRELGICGISTSGTVLASARAAADLDYRVTVLSDCCADFDDEVHALLMERVLARQVEVETAASWLGGRAG
jgi:nicotinamidase-related amidase